MKSRKPISIKESTICKHFVEHVHKLQAYNFFKKRFKIIHIPNENMSGERYGFHLKQMGMLPGAPDYVIFYEGGRVAAIEFKRDKYAYLSVHQKAFKASCEELEVPYLCTYEVDKAIEFIKSL